MPLSLRAAFSAASPRVTPRSTPLASWLIYVAVIAVWTLLLGRAFWQDNFWAWSAGIAYILYDTFLVAVVIWQTLPLRHAPVLKTPAAELPRPTLGILIAAHNEVLHLPATLERIFAQSDPPDLVLIADDGSSDDTAAVLSDRYGLASGASTQHPPLRWLQLSHRGKALALNEALLHADTDIVLTLDADTYLEPDAIERFRVAFAADPDLVAAGGIIVPFCEQDAFGRLMQYFQTYEYIRNMLARFAWTSFNGLLLISGAFAGFRRDALLKVGGFDAGCLVEDYELTHRLHRFSSEHGLRWKLAMVEGAMAMTDAPSRVGSFLRQRRRWFAGFLQTQFWYRDMTGNGRYGHVGTRMLPIKALDTLQPIYGLTAFALLLTAVVTGKTAIAFPAAGLILAKIGWDFLTFLWSIHIYRRMTQGRTRASFAGAFVAAILEPFSFQLLRHTGAAWGWVAFLRGRSDWGIRPAAVAADEQRAP